MSRDKRKSNKLKKLFCGIGRFFRQLYARYQFLIFIITALAICAVLFFVLTNDPQDDLHTVLRGVVKDIFSALCVTIPLACFGKWLTERLFNVKKNDRLLKKIGIEEVEPEISNEKMVNDIFGCEFADGYPNEICMIHLNGEFYLEKRKKQLCKCLEQGCEIKILVIDPYLSQDTLCKVADKHPLVNDYINDLASQYIVAQNIQNYKDSGDLPSSESVNVRAEGIAIGVNNVKNIVDTINRAHSGDKKIHLRFYKDEYSYTFRSARYYDKEKQSFKYKNQIFIIPLDKPKDLTICLSGTYYGKEPNNIFYHNNEVFSMLWEKYKNTDFTEYVSDGE